MADEPEIRIPGKMVDVTGVPGNEIINAKNPHFFPDKTVAEMTPRKPAPPVMTIAFFLMALSVGGTGQWPVPPKFCYFIARDPLIDVTHVVNRARGPKRPYNRPWYGRWRSRHNHTGTNSVCSTPRISGQLY